ncbi:hypothetical protein K437DRAFT_183508 [Tilletiaria anomala UBC 951]|uniref:Putative 5'-nucleotidase C-terminal domain-containing protein n=1 Tax=Tilletiaria anomala (strain ATCC 24038 / CBS 436.72 / UBC 951) TaxID=1037660 RepID=A0A066VKG6_TILAU|nr:uncharacterized protein K437DRAFT_183508 [Tilletiaria anomala UBC 951]KDN40783.1 hypothetical protein K437DRAFT_183508 [Tilletiaria anomala UBC 951]
MYTQFLSLFAAIAAASVTVACPGLDHEHSLAPRSQRGATQPNGGKSLVRPLTWGQVQVLHTTDIHGWYQGHLKASEPEPNYSADWGDFASFVSHMRKLAKKKGADLLVVDTGDLHDGAGLSDAARPVAGHDSDNFHSLIQYDVLSVGNHELYNYTIAHDTYQYFRPAQRKDGTNRYLASNVNITLPGATSSVPMGERFVKFKTDLGRRVTALGVLFDFTGQDKNLYVQKVDDMVKERWFDDAITEEPDFFLLAGHLPVRKDKWPVVINAVRAKHPDTPILVLGGHTHIRDCMTYDSNAVGIESGRYLETIGWLAVNSSSFHDHKHHGHAHQYHHRQHKFERRDDSAQAATSSNSTTVTFSRSYIDANRRNYAIHAGLTSTSKLDTPTGRQISKRLQKLADRLNLSHVFGVAPHDYYLDRVAPSDPDSLLNLLTNKVLPTVISTSNPERQGTPSIVLANSGSQRFDVYSGNLTRNDQYIVSPFLDAFLYIKDVQYQYAKQIVDQLNKAGAYRRSETYDTDAEKYARGEVDHIYTAWRRAQSVASVDERRHLAELDAHADAQQAATATLGYVTKDDCPGQGDDTVHTAIPYALQPDYIQSPPTGNLTVLSDSSPVDVVFVDFIQSSVISILNSLQKDKTYSTADVSVYNSLTTQDLYPKYAEKAWN